MRGTGRQAAAALRAEGSTQRGRRSTQRRVTKGDAMMLSTQDEAKIEAKRELLAKAVEVAERGHGGPGANGLRAGALSSLLTQYYRHVPPEDMLDRDPHDLYGAATAHYSLAAKRP